MTEPVTEPGWIPVGTLDDLWEGEMVAVVAGPVTAVLVNVGGQVYAFEDRCPHLANPLSRGRFDGRILTCAAHEWAFDGRGGGGVNPAKACLRAFAVRVVDDVISVNTEP
ncbi:MAG: toluene monooxygenase system ferredoxin subunit [Actinomycetota bacterium]|jgi:toluene monooxygenase system ferredoxin subunit|nr:toluene monooxygenase system ferredoxin subunit [Actinomycetota bacterium]